MSESTEPLSESPNVHISIIYFQQIQDTQHNEESKETIQINTSSFSLISEDKPLNIARVSEIDKQTFSFEEDLWDNLAAISTNQKKGAGIIQGFIHFCKNFNKNLQSFSHGMSKCAETFVKEMENNNGFDTTAIAINSIKAGVDEVVKVVQDKINTVVCDLIEPMELYFKQYQNSGVQTLNQAQEFWDQLEDHKIRLKNYSDKYYRQMAEVEQRELQIEQSLLEYEKGTLTLEQVQKITNSTLHIKYKTEIACQEYKREIDIVNRFLAKFEDEYKPLLQRMQQSEESRINFIKYNFEKFVKHLNALGKGISDKSQDIQNQVVMINQDTDLKIFIDENRTYQVFQNKIDFRPFEHSQAIQQKKGELIKQINDQKVINSSRQQEFEIFDEEQENQKIISYFNQLMRSRDIGFDQKGLVISALHRSSAREKVAEFLKSINSPKNIDNGQALKTLGELIKYLLTAFVHEKDENYKIIYSILHSSQFVYHVQETENPDLRPANFFQDKKRIFLTNYLCDHGIWQEQHIWRTCLNKVINQKFHEAINNPGQLSKKDQMKIKQQKEFDQQMGQGFLGYSFGKLKGAFWGTSSQKDLDQIGLDKQNLKNGGPRIQKNLGQNIVFNTLSKFLYHFVNFQFPFEHARDLILLFCAKYELDSNRTHLLLSELESIQKKCRINLTDKDLRNISIDKTKQRIQQFGNTYIMSLCLCVKYIDSDSSLRNLLCLNKETHSKIRKNVYKQALLYSEVQRLKKKRIPRENQKDYNAFKEKVASTKNIIENVEDVINMDVQRSFTKLKTLDPQVLTNILKSYAFYNPDVEYCQGMNFIAGFLFLAFRNEEVAFKALQEMIERYQMGELFNQELPKLKLFFYQMDRLVSIWLPQLHSHFKCGWKALFKMSLHILKVNEGELHQMGFEEMLNYITDQPKAALIQDCQNKDREDILYFQLKKTSQGMIDLSYLLNRLEKEFNEQKEQSKESRSRADSGQIKMDGNLNYSSNTSRRKNSFNKNKEESKGD